MRNRINYSILLLSFLTLIHSCKKDAELILDNNAPLYKGLSTIKLENYVNKLYIDLIGREALQTELQRDVEILRASDVSMAAREAIVLRLQTDETYLPGDSSYKYAYYNKLYEMAKARTLESISDQDIIGNWIYGHYQYNVVVDSTNGDSLGAEINRIEVRKLWAIHDSQSKYRNDSIDINDVFYAMVYNKVYDQINMNSFNFINAVFNDLYYRFPDINEYNKAYDMVEYNKPATLFGMSGQNKGDFIKIATTSHEFYEGLIWWTYKSFLSRSPSSSEIYTYIQELYADHDLQKLQRKVLITNEYAGF
ncbi:MAG: hypothetical protein J0M08_03230 [Bacteroidetes bacterium]|nr:hypothetical protein [Bacteroidota bacterium]